MSRDYKCICCRCKDENYLESYIENDSDLLDADATDTHESITIIHRTDAKEVMTHSAKNIFPWKCSMSDDMSEKSIAVEIMKKIDADRMSKISLQNFKLSLVFPEACPTQLLPLQVFNIFFLC